MATNAAPLVLSSFKYANNEPCVVSNKSFEEGIKMVKTDEEEPDKDSSAKLEISDKKAFDMSIFDDDNGFTDEEDEHENDENKVNSFDDDDDIEWSGDEAELSREISILEQSMSVKREHSPTKSPRKRSK